MCRVIVMKMVWPKLVLPVPYGGSHCIDKKTQMCILPLQRQGHSEALIGI